MNFKLLIKTENEQEHYSPQIDDLNRLNEMPWTSRFLWNEDFSTDPRAKTVCVLLLQVPGLGWWKCAHRLLSQSLFSDWAELGGDIAGSRALSHSLGGRASQLPLSPWLEKEPGRTFSHDSVPGSCQSHPKGARPSRSFLMFPPSTPVPLDSTGPLFTCPSE